MLRPWNIELHLDASSGKAIYLQIADAIIKDIYSGRLKGGDALPGSRNLAQLLNVNRNTVVEALNVLLIEGWLVSRQRKGTFVADQLTRIKRAALPERPATDNEKPARAGNIHFDDGHPNSKIAPIAALARSYRQIFHQKAKWQMMAYGDAYGDSAFRKEIAQMLNHQRYMQVTENELCITRGSQMALFLIAQSLLSDGDQVMIEDPGYQPAWEALKHAGATLLPVRVDVEGLLIKDVLAHLRSRKRIRAIYTTPHRQYPTTVTLSLQRRLELIRLSNEYGFVILEDDYDNEFHFGYRPVHPLSAFPELKHSVYIGTLSKVVAPALRIGYLATRDAALIKKIGALRKIIDVQGDTIMELAVLQLIRDGTIKRHIRKASQHYRAKRDFTAALLSEYLGNKARYTLPDGGLAFWIVPHKKINWLQASKQLGAKGIRIATPDTFSFDKPVNGIRLGYGALSETQLKNGIQALSALF